MANIIVLIIPIIFFVAGIALIVCMEISIKRIDTSFNLRCEVMEKEFTMHNKAVYRHWDTQRFMNYLQTAVYKSFPVNAMCDKWWIPLKRWKKWLMYRCPEIYYLPVGSYFRRWD